ncbi:MAG: 30S ribosomal protein S1 [Chloroflexota bacterium]
MVEEKAQALSTSGERSVGESDIGQAHPMMSLLEEADKLGQFEKSTILEGVIVRVTSDEILIDVGAKSEGIVTKRDLDRLGAEYVSRLKVGDQVLAYVMTAEDKNGNIILSLARAQIEKDWRQAEQLFKTQEVFESTVAGFNKGGLIVRLGRVRGFVPASQLVPQDQGDVSSEEYKAKLVGQPIQIKIIELDRERNRLILSERAAIRDWRKLQKDRLLDELSEGDIRTGMVSSLCDFGAFVDLGEADGLVHLSELSWRRVTHPSEVLEVGQEVEVYVLNVDRDRKRIGLSLKRLLPDPWTLVEERYQVGQLVEGTVTKLVKFGAFARLHDSDIEGLIHISEMSDEHVGHPKDVVKGGDVLTLRIIKIDAARKRMGLSLKRVDLVEYAEQDWDEGRAESDAAMGGEMEAEENQKVTVGKSVNRSPELIEMEAAEDAVE